jgi:hypothetical protein
VDDEAQRRLSYNEALCRQVNEAVERGLWPGEENEPARFRCECSHPGCNEIIEITVAKYERVRAHPRRFLLLAGHEIAEIEAVVDRRGDYVVVEKGGEAGLVAELSDPRAD